MFYSQLPAFFALQALRCRPDDQQHRHRRLLPTLALPNTGPEKDTIFCTRDELSKVTGCRELQKRLVCEVSVALGRHRHTRNAHHCALRTLYDARAGVAKKEGEMQDEGGKRERKKARKRLVLGYRLR